ARALGFDARGTARVRIAVADGAAKTTEATAPQSDEADEPGKVATTSAGRGRPSSRGRDAEPGERRRERPPGRAPHQRTRPKRGRRTAQGAGIRYRRSQSLKQR